MRMAELSAESGVPVATVKFYLREGLLPAGERTSPNQARYSAAHVQRLKLIRAMTDIGGLSLAAAGEVLAAIDDKEATPHDVMGVVQQELAGPPPAVAEDAATWAFELLDGMVRRNGWGELKPEHPVVANLVGTLSTIHALGHEALVEHLEEYALLAIKVAELDIDVLVGLESVDRIIEAGLVATVLGDRLFAGLRYLAEEMVSREILGERP